MWISRYPRPIEIVYDQGSEFISSECIKFLIEIKYSIPSKPSTLENPTFSAILEWIHQVLGNPVQTFNITQIYVD